MDERWLSPDEAAQMLGVHRRTILRACQRGEIPHVRFGKTVRIAGHQLLDVTAAPSPPPDSASGYRSRVRSQLPRTGTGRTW